VQARQSGIIEMDEKSQPSKEPPHCSQTLPFGATSYKSHLDAQLINTFMKEPRISSSGNEHDGDVTF
jgi:hypothetical protein